MAQGRPLAEGGRGATTPATWVMEPMSADDSAAQESAATTRRIDPERIKRALTESMTVRNHAPAQYLVARDGDDHEEHLVDVEAAACDGEDAHFRNIVCVHMVRAALHHAYRSSPNTRLVARVLAALGELGCPYDVAGCGGPTDAGQRGLPCEGCISSTSHGHWVVWQRLANGAVVEPDVDPGEGVVTDGGADRKTLDDIRDRLGDRADGVSEDDLWCLVEDWEVEGEEFDAHAALDAMEQKGQLLTDGGTVTLHPCSTCDGQAEGDAEQCPECQRRGVSDVDETPL